MFFHFHKKILAALLLGFICDPFAIASIHGWPSIPERPSGTLIYDEDRVLSFQDVQFMDSLSNLLREKAGIEIAVVLMDDIGDADFRKYAAATAAKWNIGKQTESILIFAALKQKRRTVEIGQGVDAYLSDDLIEGIQQRTLVPAFRQQKYSQGVSELLWELSQAIGTAKNISIDIQPRIANQEDKVTLSGFLFIAAVLIFLIAAKFGGGRGRGLLWLLAGNAISKSNERHNKSFNGNFGSKNNFNGGFGGGL